VAVACFAKGLVESPVTVHMEGGDLTIELDKKLNLVMTGPVEEVCVGSLSEELKERLNR
jgi:diaminopimelate epimerase